MHRLLLFILSVILVSTILTSCKENQPGEPEKNDLSGLFIYPKTVSVSGRNVADTLEVVYDDTLNVLTATLRNEDGKEIAFPETPVFSLVGTDIILGKNQRIYPVRISTSKGSEVSSKIVVKSGSWESKPYHIVVLPKLSGGLDSLITLGKVYQVTSLSQKGRVIRIRSAIFSSGRYYAGPLNSDNWTIRHKEVKGTLSDTVGTIYSKINIDNIITRMTGTEKVNNVTFGFELK